MIRRREFIAGISGAAVWPITARAQQRALPLIGWLHPETPETHQAVMPLFFKGLAEVAIFRHIDSTKREHSHLRAPSLLMRARAQATVRVWKKRPEFQAHLRFTIQDDCGLPVATGRCHEPTPVTPHYAPFVGDYTSGCLWSFDAAG
jgi:hypothetical protein